MVKCTSFSQEGINAVHCVFQPLFIKEDAMITSLEEHTHAKATVRDSVLILALV